MGKSKKIDVHGNVVSTILFGKETYISLTDIARYKDSNRSDYILQNWMRNRSTIEFIGLWEQLHNPDFKSIEFDGFKNAAGSNSFSLTPKRWIETTGAIGVLSKKGRYGGTFAHTDIAFEFASWISAEFKLYLLKEFQRLKDQEMKQLGWDIRRNLAKINYRIHTDAIKENLIPEELTKMQISQVYASEADVLNIALFGSTAKDWRETNPSEKGNMRDYATIQQLVCLSNMENLNAVFIEDALSQPERLLKLNHIAISQMKILTVDKSIKNLDGSSL
jgi:hypothetical protein